MLNARVYNVCAYLPEKAICRRRVVIVGARVAAATIELFESVY